MDSFDAGPVLSHASSLMDSTSGSGGGGNGGGGSPLMHNSGLHSLSGPEHDLSGTSWVSFHRADDDSAAAAAAAELQVLDDDEMQQPSNKRMKHSAADVP